MPRKPKTTGLDTSAAVPMLTATAPYRGFVKVEREPLDHPMFRGHMDWIGAWVLIQAAANYQTNQVNLTDVGRRASRDFGWDNEKWRRFVRRLEKEGFVETVEKKNLGDQIGYRHIAQVLGSRREQGGIGSDVGALKGDTTVRNSDDSQDEPAPIRSDKGSDTISSNGAPGGVLKESKKITDSKSVVNSEDENKNVHVPQRNNDDDGTRPTNDPSSEVDSFEGSIQADNAPPEEASNPYAQAARQFFVDLVAGDFAEYLEKKIEEGEYRADLFEYWYEEYSEGELKEAWGLAKTVRNSRNDFRFGERLTYIDLLNDRIKATDNVELRVWVEQHEGRKEAQRLSYPLHYSACNATKAFPKVVLETKRLPSVIDIFDAESDEALDVFVMHDDVISDRRDAAFCVISEPGDKNIYYFINAAPNPEVGVTFHLDYFANSKYFRGDEDALLETLESLVVLLQESLQAAKRGFAAPASVAQGVQ